MLDRQLITIGTEWKELIYKGATLQDRRAKSGDIFQSYDIICEQDGEECFFFASEYQRDSRLGILPGQVRLDSLKPDDKFRICKSLKDFEVELI